MTLVARKQKKKPKKEPRIKVNWAIVTEVLKTVVLLLIEIIKKL